MKPESLLLVDMGNSRVKWAISQSGFMKAGEPFASRVIDFRAELDRCWAGLPVPGGAVVVNVAGPGPEETARDWMFSHWGLAPHFVRAESRAHGVVNGYDDPSALGADRWVCLLAARRRCPGPLCVADCGTALTLDAVDGGGRHMGGAIGPGLEMMRRSLMHGTGGLHHIVEGRPDVLGRNTADAVRGGVLQMAAGAIERFVGRLERMFGCMPSLFLTGGDAVVIAGELEVSFLLVPDLMLRGLLLIAEGDS